MGVHPNGDGAGWTLVETVDIDQPHGKDYLYSQHIAKGVRKRMDQEHSTFADATAGGIHLPGGAAVLGVDYTDDCTVTVVADGTYRARGLIWAYSDTSNFGVLFCNTSNAGVSTCGDFTVMKLHPDLQWAGRDVTWAGAHEFDASVDISGNVAMDGDLTVDGKLILDSSADVSDVYVNGDLSMSGTLKVATDFSLTGDMAMDGTANFNADVNLTPGSTIGCIKESGATLFNATMTAANTYQDLDLSGTVGSNYALVMLEISGGLTNGTFYSIKSKGYGSATLAEQFQSGAGPCGGAVVEGDGVTLYSYVTVMTDSAGVLSHAHTNNTDTITVKVIGYIR